MDQDDLERDIEEVGKLVLAHAKHEHGRLADEVNGLRPMTQAWKPLRQPPSFPLAAYLVMVRGA